MDDQAQAQASPDMIRSHAEVCHGFSTATAVTPASAATTGIAQMPATALITVTATTQASKVRDDIGDDASADRNKQKQAAMV